MRLSGKLITGLFVTVFLCAVSFVSVPAGYAKADSCLSATDGQLLFDVVLKQSRCDVLKVNMVKDNTVDISVSDECYVKGSYLLGKDFQKAAKKVLIVPKPLPKSLPEPEVTPTPTPEPTPEPTPGSQPSQDLKADEQRMLELVNQARAEAGLQPLQMDDSLVELARLKAQDMADKNYFGHTSPTYGSPFDMLRSYGIKYNTAGENLAKAPTVDTAHSNLMKSPGHRDNILKSGFDQVGIGVVNNGTYGKIFVQIFVG